ncbi:hypothetical protein TWF481_004831 [Arthrobotrys musiformis]|uniref:MARVEL domain-containing protein n=1 Tax=Arthrobotrys musiformis TaxID=47236 RepID=A0AAV9WRE6_9PEZI
MSLKAVQTLTGRIILGILRALQLVLACAVIGLYGKYLSRASEADEHADARWIWGVVVGGLSAVTAVSFFLLSLFFGWVSVVL